MYELEHLPLAERAFYGRPKKSKHARLLNGSLHQLINQILIGKFLTPNISTDGLRDECADKASITKAALRFCSTSAVSIYLKVSFIYG